MKKEMVLVLMVLVLFIGSFSLVSAEYGCSDGGVLDEDRKEIDIYDRKTINGLGLGLVSSYESFAMGRYAAELIIDGRKFSLSNVTPSVLVDFAGGEKNVSLVNITGNEVILNIGGSSGTLELEDVVTIGSFVVLVSSSSGSYPGADASVEGIAGVEKVSLDNENLFELITFEGRKYLLELFSASDDNALVTVAKCDNESADIIEIASSVVNVSNGEVNDSVNESVVDLNDSVNESVNDSVVVNESDDGEDLDEGSESGKDVYFWIFVISVVVIILVVVIFLLRGVLSKGEV